MPIYRYECVKEEGGCGTVFKDRRSVATMHNTECPCCGAYGGHAKRNGKRRIIVLMPKVHQIHDLDHSEGRTGDAHFQPAFGKMVRTKGELADLQKRAREELYNRTAGDHESFVQDPDTGKMEKVTVHSEGIDVGEIRTVGNESFTPPDLGTMARDTAMKEIKAAREGKGKK